MDGNSEAASDETNSSKQILPSEENENSNLDLRGELIGNNVYRIKGQDSTKSPKKKPVAGGESDNQDAESEESDLL